MGIHFRAEFGPQTADAFGLHAIDFAKSDRLGKAAADMSRRIRESTTCPMPERLAAMAAAMPDGVAPKMATS